MLDIRYIRDNPKEVQQSIARRGLVMDVEELLAVDTTRRRLIAELEVVQASRNAIASQGKNAKPSSDQISQGKELKSQHEALELELNNTLAHYNELLSEVPNIIAEGTPDGDEENNQEIYKWGNTDLGFEPKDHLEISELYNLYDFEAGAKVSGNKFYFTRHKAVKLWQAIQLATQEIVEAAGFELISVPHLVSTDIAAGSGFLPKGEENQNYLDKEQNLVLIATSEIPITGLHSNEVLELDSAIKYAGISPCYRLEAGAYGKFSKGLYRTHQFDKLEMYVFCRADQSDATLQAILKIERQICEQFEIPYRVVRIAAGDLSTPAYEKYDVEYYSPVDGRYRELTSCSNCTDFQARNLNIRYRDEAGKLAFAHTLNGTAVVSSRMPIAILENHQTADGKIKLPKPIAKYYGSDEL
ncbi:MAG: serine--tRNA ligase [bacterium]